MTIASLPHPIPPDFARAVLRVTAEQYHVMIERDIVPDGGPYELLDGFIVHKDRSVLGKDPMSHDPLHVTAIKLLTTLASRVGDLNHMQFQLPIALTPLYEPEPDAAIIRGTLEDYRTHLPTGSDALCVIEAAHSSLARDQDSKLAAYAAAGIPQYLIINLQAGWIEVYSEPDTILAAYRTKSTASRHQSVALHLGNGAHLTVLVSDLLP